jgi:hypothetical protein
MCKCCDCNDRPICEGCMFSCRLCPKSIHVSGLCPLLTHVRCFGAFQASRMKGHIEANEKND